VHRRFEVLKKPQKAGILTIVWMTPILPFINDTAENIRRLLDYCLETGAHGLLAFDIGITLRSGKREYFCKQLETYFPELE